MKLRKCGVGPVKKIQVLKLFQTSFQRYENLASVKLLDYVLYCDCKMLNLFICCPLPIHRDI